MHRSKQSWDGTSTGVAPALELLSSDVDDGGGRIATPAGLEPTLEPSGEVVSTTELTSPAPRLLQRLRNSAWTPILGRTAFACAALLGFGIVGSLSMQTQEPGVHLLTQASPSASVEWLAPQPAGLVPRPVASASAAAEHNLGCSGKDGELCDGGVPKPPEGLTSDGKVILNLAGPEVLTRLPGIGQRRAEAIVALRTRLKRFRRVTDLLRVRGIGIRSLKRMEPHLVLDPPKVPEVPPAPAPSAGAPIAPAPSG